MSLGRRRCLGWGGWAVRRSCACLGSLAHRFHIAVGINGYCPSASFTDEVTVKSHLRASQVVYYIASRRYRACRWPPSYRPEDVRKVDPVEIAQIPQGDGPSRPSPVVHPFVHRSGDFPQRSLSSRMAAIPELSDTPNQERNEEEKARPDSSGSSTLSGEESKHRSAESGATPPKSLRRTKSSRDAHAASSSSRHAALASNAGEGDLQGFAEQFRALVDQVSRELEEARNLEYNTEIDRDARTPPLHHVLDTHTPYMTIDEFGREVPSEESIAVLGSVIKRMPTIESVGSRELASLRSATLLSGNGCAGMGSASIATSSAASSRPLTGATMASFEAASTSQPPSRSNSTHRLRTPSELGELVRDALRARGQPRPMPGPRPGSGGSLSGSASGAAESVGPPPRSRSNSLGPNEVLPSVTEHGELGREDPPPRPPRRRGDVPEQLLVGTSASGGGNANVSEMGDLLRAEWTRSWTSSSPSATSTFVTAGTSGSLVGGSGSGGGGGSGGGDTGTGGSGGPQVAPRK